MAPLPAAGSCELVPRRASASARARPAPAAAPPPSQQRPTPQQRQRRRHRHRTPSSAAWTRPASPRRRSRRRSGLPSARP